MGTGADGGAAASADTRTGARGCDPFADLNDEQTSETSAAATDVLRRFALYSSWTCTFVSSEDVPDTDGYTAVIICTDPNRALNASVALAIQESKLPVFVIGAGGLAS